MDSVLNAGHWPGGRPLHVKIAFLIPEVARCYITRNTPDSQILPSARCHSKLSGLTPSSEHDDCILIGSPSRFGEYLPRLLCDPSMYVVHRKTDQATGFWN